jgi:MFS family permease
MSGIVARPAPRFLARAIAPKREWLALGALALVSFLLTLDDTALSVALPSIGRDLGLGLSGLEWVVNAYTLALAALLLAGGWLADALGSRRIFLTGLALFSAASLGAALAPAGALLIAGRVLPAASRWRSRSRSRSRRLRRVCPRRSSWLSTPATS